MILATKSALRSGVEVKLLHIRERGARCHSPSCASVSAARRRKTCLRAHACAYRARLLLQRVHANRDAVGLVSRFLLLGPHLPHVRGRRYLREDVRRDDLPARRHVRDVRAHRATLATPPRSRERASLLLNGWEGGLGTKGSGSPRDKRLTGHAAACALRAGASRCSRSGSRRSRPCLRPGLRCAGRPARWRWQPTSSSRNIRARCAFSSSASSSSWRRRCSGALPPAHNLAEPRSRAHRSPEARRPVHRSRCGQVVDVGLMDHVGNRHADGHRHNARHVQHNHQRG